MDEAVKVMDATGASIPWQEAYAGLAVGRFYFYLCNARPSD
ncbi:hypothetical protein [Candidatus Methylobacter favarea]